MMMMMTVTLMMSVCSKQRRSSSGTYEKDDRLSEKEKELMEKDAEVSSTLYYCGHNFLIWKTMYIIVCVSIPTSERSRDII